MRMRVLIEKLRVEIENETRFFLESLNFEIEMRVSQKSDYIGRVSTNFLMAFLALDSLVSVVTSGGAEFHNWTLG